MPLTISPKTPATPREVAAIASAVENFLNETGVAPAPPEPEPRPWLKAALAEGVSAKAGFGPGNPDDLF